MATTIDWTKVDRCFGGKTIKCKNWRCGAKFSHGIRIVWGWSKGTTLPMEQDFVYGGLHGGPAEKTGKCPMCGYPIDAEYISRPVF